MKTMGKYENAKFLIRRTARKEWLCCKCGKEIKTKEEYYRESLGLMDKGPHIVFETYCLDCGLKSGLPIK